MFWPTTYASSQQQQNSPLKNSLKKNFHHSACLRQFYSFWAYDFRFGYRYICTVVKQAVQLLQIEEVRTRLYFTVQRFCRLLPVFSTGSTLAIFEAQNFEQRSEDRKIDQPVYSFKLHSCFFACYPQPLANSASRIKVGKNWFALTISQA